MNQNKPSMLTGKWNEKLKFRNNWLRRVMSRQRIPADTQRLLRESISEFNADADKG